MKGTNHMKMSKADLLKQLEEKSPQALATEIATIQLAQFKTPEGYSVDFDATVQKYTTMLEKLVQEEMLATSFMKAQGVNVTQVVA